jgi:hypothetical protein
LERNRTSEEFVKWGVGREEVRRECMAQRLDADGYTILYSSKEQALPGRGLNADV